MHNEVKCSKLSVVKLSVDIAKRITEAYINQIA